MTQLTLTLDDETARQAMKLAADSGRSVDEVVTALLRAAAKEQAWRDSLPPITRSLLGIAPSLSDEEVKAVLDEERMNRYGGKREPSA